MGNSASQTAEGLTIETNGFRLPIHPDRIDAYFRMVYECMQKDDAVEDLELPRIASFPTFTSCCSKITIKFVKMTSTRPLPISTTVTVGISYRTKIDVYYNKYEAKCDDKRRVLIARVIHEATNALRAQIILQSEVAFHPRLSLSIPNRAYYTNRGKLFLENDKFLPGYWMEHALYGGVWLTLKNVMFLDINNDTVTVAEPDGMMFFAVRNIVANYTTRTMCDSEVGFHCIEGNTTGDITELNNVHIYYSGTLGIRNCEVPSAPREIPTVTAELMPQHCN